MVSYKERRRLVIVNKIYIEDLSSARVGEIMKLALDCREVKFTDISPTKNCGFFSSYMSIKLEELGYFNYLMYGFVETADGERRQHIWLNVGNLFLDCSADQFNEHMPEPMSYKKVELRAEEPENFCRTTYVIAEGMPREVFNKAIFNEDYSVMLLAEEEGENAEVTRLFD